MLRVKFLTEDGESIEYSRLLAVPSAPQKGDQVLLPGRERQWDRYEVLYAIWTIDRIDVFTMNATVVEIVVRLIEME